MNITDGVIRARYRDSFERAEFMEPGTVYEFTIELYPTSNLFAKGHRIRVDIASSNFPRLDVNPNTGEPLGLSRRTEIARNTVYHDADRPSPHRAAGRAGAVSVRPHGCYRAALPVRGVRRRVPAWVRRIRPG